MNLSDCFSTVRLIASWVQGIYSGKKKSSFSFFFLKRHTQISEKKSTHVKLHITIKWLFLIGWNCLVSDHLVIRIYLANPNESLNYTNDSWFLSLWLLILIDILLSHLFHSSFTLSLFLLSLFLPLTIVFFPSFSFPIVKLTTVLPRDFSSSFSDTPSSVF